MSVRIALLFACLLATLGLPSSLSAAPERPAVFATVNGTPITENQVAFFCLVHGLPQPLSADVQRTVVDKLVEDEAMRQWLADRRAEADPKRLAERVDEFKNYLRRIDLDPAKTSKKLGYTDAMVRRDLSLPLMWEAHMARAVTDTMIRDEFDHHRAEYDGSEVRASQIFFKLPSGEAGHDESAARDKLAKIRAEIVGGQISFADAARKFSQAPSSDQGGDLGFFAYVGKMPAEITRAVFPLKKGDVSQPVRTPFGLHLYQVTDRRAGNLSLEDVRPAVIRRLSKDLWTKLSAEARSKAKIEITADRR